MFWKILFFVIRLILFIALPFIVLIRGAIFVHVNYQFNAWISIGFGSIIMSFVLFLYFTFFYGKFTGKLGRKGWFKRRAVFIGSIVFLYVFQSMLFLSAKNAKSGDVRKEFSSIHPILRLATSTFLLLDRQIMITDASRAPEDYKKMGLKTNQHSLHYKQKDGFTHAVDFRTHGKAEWKNLLLHGYFKAMGFNVLRHEGTEDHLHISILSHDRPRGI
jgi:hypothetical protein